METLLFILFGKMLGDDAFHLIWKNALETESLKLSIDQGCGNSSWSGSVGKSGLSKHMGW